MDATLFAEVSALQAAYCRGVDDRDPAILRSLITDDVEFVGADESVHHGADAFMAVFDRYWETVPRPGLHLVTNIEVVGDGPVFESWSYFHAVSSTADGVVTKTWGRYRDHVTRAADGRLVFAAKRVLLWGRERQRSEP